MVKFVFDNADNVSFIIASFGILFFFMKFVFSVSASDLSELVSSVLYSPKLSVMLISTLGFYVLGVFVSSLSTLEINDAFSIAISFAFILFSVFLSSNLNWLVSKRNKFKDHLSKSNGWILLYIFGIPFIQGLLFKFVLNSYTFENVNTIDTISVILIGLLSVFASLMIVGKISILSLLNEKQIIFILSKDFSIGNLTQIEGILLNDVGDYFVILIKPKTTIAIKKSLVDYYHSGILPDIKVDSAVKKNSVTNK